MSQELAAIGSLHRSAEREQAAAHRLEGKQQGLKISYPYPNPNPNPNP